MPFRDGSFDVVFHQGLLEHFRDAQPIVTENARVLRPGGTLVADVPQRYHAWTALKKVLIAMNRWFAGWETQFSPRELERMVERERLTVRRTYGDFMVPGLAYRALRVGLARVGLPFLPLYPRGPAWWERAWESWRAWLLRRRFGLYTCFVIGVVAEKDAREPAEASRA
jgi:SAM-dependent methyltransferase